MDTKEKFKIFIKDNPKLIDAIKDGKTTYQKLYELYDMNDGDEKVFESFYEKDEVNLKKLTQSLKNINVDEIKKNLDSLQNIMGFVSEFITPNKEEVKVEKVINPKPLDNLFDD